MCTCHCNQLFIFSVESLTLCAVTFTINLQLQPGIYEMFELVLNIFRAFHVINSHKSLSTSQLIRVWTVITCVNGSTWNPRCSHLHMEPKLISRAARCALKGRKIYSIWPIHNIVFNIKYLKLHLARHICISHNTYRVILFTSLPYSIIRKN